MPFTIYKYQIEFLKCELSTLNHDEKLDIRNMIVNFSYTESFFTNYIRGEAVIVDLEDIYEKFPIIGEEFLEITFNKYNKQDKEDEPKDNEEEDEITFKFRVYQVSDIKSVKERSTSYKLHLISPDYINNLKRKFSKSYVDEKAEDIVQDIFTNYIKSELELKELTTTKYNIQHNFSWSPPYSAINTLANRVVLDEFVGCDIRFFQTTKGYFFKSLQELIKKGNETKPEKEATNNDDSKETIEGVKEIFRWQNVLISDVYSTHNLTEENIIKYQFLKKDNLTNMTSGIYANKIITYDFYQGKYNTQTFKLADEFKDFQHTKDEEEQWFTQKEDLDVDDNAVLSYLFTRYKQNENDAFKKYSDEIIYPTYIEEYLPQNIAQNQMWSNNLLVINVNGKITRTVGDLVYVFLPRLSGTVGDEENERKYYAGRYIILEIQHTIDVGNAYSHRLLLHKESYNVELNYEYKEEGEH